MVWRFAVLLLAGCWTSSSAPAQSPVVSNTSPPPSAEVPRPPTKTTWEGRYVCAQGVTALRVSLQHACMPDVPGQPCAASGTFEFGPLGQNPTVPTGSYSIVGEVRVDAQGQLVMLMEPDAWIQQPTNYIMVGFTASTDPDRRTLDGRIDNPGCAGINLVRVD